MPIRVYNSIVAIKSAGVSELADETDSKSVVSNGVWVRVPPPAPKIDKCHWALVDFLYDFSARFPSFNSDLRNKEINKNRLRHRLGEDLTDSVSDNIIYTQYLNLKSGDEMYNPRLETFLRVADAGSFNKAAEESYITPTAVIKHINLLEAELGVRLFERTHRGLKLTNAGKSLYQDSKYIIRYCRDSVTRAKNAMQEDMNVIRIGTSPMTPAQLLMPLWQKIQTRCPDMKFQIVPFENTEENAREILGNLGRSIDVVGGIFDETMLKLRGCAGLTLSQEPFCCAVSVHHHLAAKDKLTVEDLHGENLLLMRRGWSHYVDALRDELWKNHSEIHILDFEFYNMDVFNRCENSNDVLLAIPGWANVHPLLKVIPTDWNFSIPYGLLHSPTPSERVKNFLTAAADAAQNTIK